MSSGWRCVACNASLCTGCLLQVVYAILITGVAGVLFALSFSTVVFVAVHFIAANFIIGVNSLLYTLYYLCSSGCCLYWR